MTVTRPAPTLREAGIRAPHDRQVVVISLALLAVNGLVCWLNMQQQTSLLAPVIHLSNYVLLGLWFAMLASVRAGGYLWVVAVVGLIIVASHAYLYVVQPAHFSAGWTFWLTNVVELLSLAAVVAQELRARRAVPEPTTSLAPVVAMRRQPVVSATAEVRRAA